uniref:Uncharacterized protein n=1 Tax=Mycena chlorophos TaxID=658473 RepID=A0ABQ0M003_MYCCL|nr:predicted protein [Mycena chlorophos]
MPSIPPPVQQANSGNSNGAARRTLSVVSGRISALSASLRMARSPEPDEERVGSVESTEPSRGPAAGYFSGRAGLGNHHSPAESALDEQEFPWPRGRQRTRGSHSVGRGGYGNIATAHSHTGGDWAYSAHEQEILAAHAEARRVAMPIGRGGYGNIAHARALAAEAEAAAARSHSVDPVNAPMSMSFRVPLPVPGYGDRQRGQRSMLNGHKRRGQRDDSDAESDSDFD